MKKSSETKKPDPKKLIFITAVILLACAAVIAGIIFIKPAKKIDGESTAETTDKVVEKDPSKDDKFTTLLWSDGDTKLWCNDKDADNTNEKGVPLKLTVNDKEIFFNGYFSHHVDSRTEFYSTDVTGDDTPDHILILPTDSGTGVKRQEIHVFCGKTLKEIPADDPLKYLNTCFTFSSSESEYHVAFAAAIYSYPKAIFSTHNSEFELETPVIDEWWFDFNVTETEDGASRISATYFITPAEWHFDIIAECSAYFTYTGTELICDEFSYEPYQVIQTNNENWFARISIVNEIYVSNKETTHTITNSSKIDHVDFSDKKPYAFIDSNEEYCVLVYRDTTANENSLPMQYASFISLEHGTVITDITDNLYNILKHHGYETDSVSEYLSGDEPLMFHTLEAKEIGGELVLYSTVESYDNKIKLSGHYVIEGGYSPKYVVDSTVFDDKSSEPELLKELQSMDNVDPDLANAATAFITKNTALLEELLGCRQGVLRQYKDFEFENYSLSYNDRTLYLNVTITESSLPDVQPGTYTISFSPGRFATVSMSGIGIKAQNTTMIQETDSLHDRYVKSWILSTGLWDFSSVEEINASEDSYSKTPLVMFLRYYDKDMKTVEEFKEAAKAIFGIEDLDIPESCLNEDGTVKDSWGMGGSVRTYRITGGQYDPDTDVTTVYILTYADFAGTVQSDMYEYRFKNCGDYLQVIYSGICRKGDYPPEDRYFA